MPNKEQKGMIEAARNEAADHARTGDFDSAATIAGAANQAESAIQKAEREAAKKANRNAIDHAHFSQPIQIDYPPL